MPIMAVPDQMGRVGLVRLHVCQVRHVAGEVGVVELAGMLVAGACSVVIG